MAKSGKSSGLFVLILVLLVAGAAGGGWYYWDAKKDKQPEFFTTTAGRGELTQVVTATGDLQPVTSIDVSSQISGLILEVPVDFNTPVKVGQLLARIDPATYESRLMQAKADLLSTEANSTLVRLNTERTRELRAKNLVSQQELDQAEALLKQSTAQLQTRQAAVADAEVNLKRCNITAPIDGVVLSKIAEKGKTVSASTSAPTLFVLVNDLSKMQIDAAVAEADIGNIEEGQEVTFTVDAFPNRQFRGRVSQVRNAAKANQNVVSYETLIDVSNDDLKLKPGMTANVSIVIAHKSNILRVANSALRVRVPAELVLKKPSSGPEKAAMSEDDRRKATMEILRDAGWSRGSPITPEVQEKAAKAAKEKGMEADLAALVARFQSGQGGRRGGDNGGGGGGGSRRGGNSDRTPLTNTVTTRTLYRLVETAPNDKKAEAVPVKLGISDGLYTEVIEGLNDNDTLVTGVSFPGTNPAAQAPAGANNPFQGGGGGGGRRGGF
jgi:HlyD family secretion protein